MSNPLGLPEGSVRSIITILLVGATIYCQITGIDANILYGFAGMAIADYYNSRKKINS